MAGPWLLFAAFGVAALALAAWLDGDLPAEGPPAPRGAPPDEEGGGEAPDREARGAAAAGAAAVAAAGVAAAGASLTDQADEAEADEADEADEEE